MPRSLVFALVLLTPLPALAAGTWVDTSFVPPSLGFDNQVRIYLPEGYDPQGSIDYPVVYFLHGWMVMGNPGHQLYSADTKDALDSLISSGQMDPVIVVKPNGTCPPYNGSMWANSELYGDYEDYVVYDLVDFMEEAFCVSAAPWKRCIAGHSMGASGSMDIALRHPDRYRAVASHSGAHDFITALPIMSACVIDESPEPSPPYTYDWGNGFFTDAFFLFAGGWSPNLSAPDSVDFLLDSNGDVIDSVYALWELHNPTHMAKLLPQPIELGIFFDCGEGDELPGVYEGSAGFSDTLTSLGKEHVFLTWPGVGHSMNLDRFIEEFLFLDEQMTGITEDPVFPTAVTLHQAFPNPFSGSTTISFELSEECGVRLDVFDISGRLVETAIEGKMAAGEHSVLLNGSGMASGVYLIRLQSGSEVETERVVMVQ